MKNPLLLLTFFLAHSFVWAIDIPYVIKQENSVTQIQTELQMLINDATATDRVVVTGSKTDADITLSLLIGVGKTVVWQAVYQSVPTLAPSTLLEFSGSGTFELADGALICENTHALHATGTSSKVIVSGTGKIQTSGAMVQGEDVHAIKTSGYVEIKDNAQIIGTGGEVIASFSNNATVAVSGGTITTNSGNAIITFGKDAKILISGGYVSNNAKGLYPAVIALDESPGNNNALVHVSGTAIVEAKGDGNAIISNGGVILSGNAHVSNTNGGANNTAAVWSTNPMEMKDNAKISVSKGYGIVCQTIIIKDSCIIEAKDNAVAVFLAPNGGMGLFEIRDKAQVIAANNYAIKHNASELTLNIFGGTLFAYGNRISDVIFNVLHPDDSNVGVILAWNKDAGNTIYQKGSNDDIFKTPEDAVAHWYKKGDQHGIYYENGSNTGFIPIETVTVEEVGIVETLCIASLQIYPNPTTGELTINNGQLTINTVEVYDVLGRKVLVPPLTVLRSYDLTVLHPGIYFVRVGNDWTKVVKQ